MPGSDYSYKYNIGFIRNSPINWQNSQNGAKGYVEFADWGSGVRANSLNAQAKLSGPRTIINENNQQESVNANLGGGYADLPNLTRINTPPRTSSGGIENDAAFRGKYGEPGSDAYKYGQYYDNVKKGITNYVNDPASGYSDTDKQRILDDLNSNKINLKDAKSLEAYNAGIMRAEHTASDYKEFLANRDGVRNGVNSALGEKVLDNIPPNKPGDSNAPPDRFKPGQTKPTDKPPSSPTDDKWRQENMKRLMRLVGQENILNRLNQ